MAKQLNVNLAFTADTGQARAQIQDLQNQLSHLSTSVGAGQTLGLTKELNEAAVKVTELKGLLASSTTPMGTLDLGKFNEGLKKSGTTIKDYARSLNALGPEGQKAFAQLAQSITTAEMPMRRANGLLNEMWTTMKNTARWQLTSSMIHGFMGGLQRAVGYAKDLNKTLTDIRIVAPEKSMEDMYQFAALANKQAKELSSTTLDYAKGALIYYQQGLDDVATKERTDVTTKMANVTGDSVDEVSSYMTSIWNNFNKAGDESEEHFADILTKLGAETAASTTEITAALEKYTGVANTIGLSYESATAAATTLIDRLREQPEVAGTALKTIFARLEGLKLEGETSEGGTTTSLNKYSEALHKIGVEIKDASGEMREADDILMDIGEKWNSGDLSKDVKIATAETVAGIRQWQQFSALMDNFDYFKQYKDLAATGSEGALQEQQEIYAESWEAASNRVKASIQTIYMQLLDDKFFIKMTNTIADVVDKISKVIDGMGGLKTLLPAIGTLMLAAFGDKIAKSMSNTIYNMRLFGKTGKEEMQKLREEANNALINQEFGRGKAGKASAQAAEDQYNIQKQILAKQKELNEFELKQAQNIADRRQQRGEELRLLGQQIDKEKSLQETEAKRAGARYGNGQNNSNVKKQYESAQNLGNKAGYITHMTEDLSNANFALDNTQKKLIAQKKEFDQIQQKAQSEGRALTKEEENKQKEIERTNQLLKEQQQEYERKKAEYNKTSREKGYEDLVLQEGSSLGARHSDVSFLTGTEEQTWNKFDQKLQSLRQNSSLTGQELRKLEQEWVNAGGNVAKFTAALTENERAALAEEKAIEEMGKKAPNATQGLMVLSSVLMELTMAVNAFKNLDEIWSNEELSTGEKVLETLTAISMILPLIITLTNSENIAKLAGIPISAARAAGTLNETAATKLATEANKGFTASLLAAGKASKAFLLSPLGIALMAIAAAAVAAGIAFKKWYNETHKARIAAEEIQEKNQELNKNLEETKTTAEGLSDSLGKVKNAAEELKNTEFGSSEWTSKLSEANKESSELIDNYEELRKKAGLLNDEKYDLIEGEDYYIDGSGLRQFTEAGELKIEDVKSISVHNADVQLNANKIVEERANLAASIEELQYSAGREVFDSGAIAETVKEASKEGVMDLAHGAYQISNGYTADVNTAVKERNFNIESIAETLMSDYSFNESSLDVGTIDQKFSELTEEQQSNYLALKEAFGEDFVEELQKSEEFQSGIYEVVQQMKGLQEKQVQAYENQLMSNQEVKDKLFDPEKSNLTEAEREKWSGGIVSTMAEDMQRRVDARKGLKENQLIEGQYKTATEARTAFAEQNNMTYNAKDETFTRTGEDGKEETVKHSEYTGQYKEWLATAEAEERATENLKNYKAEIKDSEEDWKSLDNIKKSLQSQEKAINRASKVLKKYGGDVQKLFKSTSKEAKSAQEDFNDLAITIKDDLSEALDVDVNNTIIDGEFVANNLGLIQDAMEGDLNALEELRDAYGQAQVESVFEAHLDESAFENIKDEMNSQIANIQDGLNDLSVGMELSPSVQASMNELLRSCEMTRAEAEAIVDGFGVEAEIEDTKLEGTKEESSYEGVDAEAYTADELNLFSTEVSADAGGFSTIVHPIGEPLPVEAIRYNKGDKEKAVKETAPDYVSTWRLKTGKKGDGKIAPTKKAITLPRNTGGGGSKGAPARQSSGGGGRRGSGRRGSRRARERTVEKARRQNEKTKVLERYKEITDKLERNSRVSDRLSKVQDKLYGKARLDQMDKVNKKHLEEIKLLEKKQKEARQYYLNDRRDAEKALKQAMKVSKQVQKQEHERLTVAQKNALNDIKGLKFNKSGEITNYTDILKALQDQLNAYERVYNSAKEFGNAESQSKYKEKYIDPLKEQIDSLKEAIDQYDETRELAEEVRDQIEEAYTAWQQSNYEKLQYALELKVTINDNDLKRIDYYLSKTSGNVYKAAEALGQYFGTSSKGIANFQKSSNKLQERLKELEKSREEVQKKINERTDKEKDKRKDYNKLKNKKKVKNKKYGKKRTYTINGEKVTLNKKEGAKYWSKSIERNLKKKRDAAKKAYEKKKNDKNVSEKEKERLKNKYLKAEAKLREVQQIRRKYQAKLDKYIEEGAKGLKGIKQKRNSYRRDTVTYKTKSGKKRTVSIEKLTKEYNEAYKKQKKKVEELKKLRDKYKNKKSSKEYKKYSKQYDEAKNKLENITKRYENRLFKNNKYNQKKYDYAKKKYNNYAKKAEEQKKKRDKLKKDSPEWTKANEQYKKYLDLRKKWKKLFKKQQTNKAQYEKWSIAYENYKKLNDELKKRNQIIKNQEKAIAEANKNLTQFTMLTASGGKIGAVTKAIYNQVQAFEDLSTSYKLAQITQADYIDSMQQIHDEIYSLLSELQDLKNELKGYYGETLTNALDELNKYNDKLTHNESLISHFQNIANLSRWDDSNDQWTDKFLLAQQESIGTKLENDRKLLKNLQDERDEALLKRNKFILNEVAGKNLSDQKLLNASLADINGVLDSDALSDERKKWIDKKIKEAKAERNQAKKELDNLLKNENASQKKINEAKEKYLKANATVEQYSNVSEEEFKDLINTTYEYYDEIYQSLSANFDQIQEEFYSTAEEALENANNLLEEFCDRAASNMERLLTGIAGGFEELSKRISLTSQLQEDYLTKTNQDYELNKMQRTLQKDIDKANSKTAKNKLSNFAKELKSLQESNKLSNLELEIAQKRYEILKAQIELEESRGAKQTIRLSRDNEGNYGYVYVANEEETEDAEQNVKNLENDLYNLLRENINNREQSYIQLAQDRENALTEIWGRFYNQEITASERDELLANANKQYSQLMESQSHLINIASTSVEGISDLAKQDSWVDSEYSGFVTRIQNNLAAYDAYSENMRNAYKQFEATVSQLHITGDTVNEELTKISETNADVLNDFNTSLNKIDKVLDEVQDKILKFTQNTLPIIESQISVVEDKLQSFADTIERFVTGKLNTNDVAYTNFSTLITRLADNAGVATEDTMLWNNGVAFNAEVGGKAFYNSNKWGSDVAKTNDKTAGKMLDIINSGEGAVGTRVFGVSEEGYLFYLLTNKTMQDSDNGVALKKKIEEWKDKHNIKQKVDDILTYQQFASGGYTGDWNTGGQEGKIGILHEKELVLNQTDTSNILAAVEGMRELASSGFLNSLSALSLPDKLLANSAQQLDQNVSIEASFPNVTDRNEIEQAFNNLVNRASQYAYTNRK